MSFLGDIFGALEKGRDRVVLQEIQDGETISVTGGELLELVGRAQSFLSGRGWTRGDRCGLLGHNGIRWVALDLAIMAEGLIVVPLYARQAADELVAMMRDCSPALVCCGDAGLRDGIAEHRADGPPLVLFEEIFAAAPASGSASANWPGKQEIKNSDAVTIIYTSGTSGEAKGVVLTAGNVGHMLGCTSGRLDLLNDTRQDGSLRNVKDRQDRVFHYLPFCFAGSWIMLLTCLLRGSLLTLNTDLSKLAGEMRGVGPDYFLNVPALLERMRRAVDEQIWKTGGVIQFIYGRAKAAWARNFPALSLQKKTAQGRTRVGDKFFLWLAGVLVFPTIRKKMIGSNLKALICGSAPLNMETQLYFMMLEIPVLQVYGLTETTAICTMDDPRNVEPGRVGPAIAGVEMRLGANDEIIVRGPNVFPGYWKREQETAKVLRGGWFHTGDQGQVNAEGNWRIVGRIKNLIVLGSGHNVAPEPIEDEIVRELGGGQQVVLVGNGRGYLCALVTGAVASEQVQVALGLVNTGLPHYKQVRGFHICSEPFSIENGMLTANGKLRRDVIGSRYRQEIEALYEGNTEYRVPSTECGARRLG